MLHTLSYYFGCWWDCILFSTAVLSRTSILALVVWMVSKLGTFYVGSVITFCAVCFGGLVGFASLLVVFPLC
jgi:hypothetical protein